MHTRRDARTFLGIFAAVALLSPLLAGVLFARSGGWTSLLVACIGYAGIAGAIVVRLYRGTGAVRGLTTRARAEHPGAEVFAVAIRDEGRGVLIADDGLLLLRTAGSEVLRVERAGVASVTAVVESMHTVGVAITIGETVWVLPVLGERLGLPRGERATILVAERISDALELQPA